MRAFKVFLELKNYGFFFFFKEIQSIGTFGALITVKMTLC